MKTFLSFIICIVSVSGYAQQRMYDVIVNYGAYESPNLKNNHYKDFFSVDFDYHLSKRWTLGSGFLSGQFRYYEDVRSNNPESTILSADGSTNGRGYDFHAYGVSKYSVVNNTHFCLQAGLGVGIVIRRLKFPYREPSSSGGATFVGEYSTASIEFPINVEAYYVLSKRIGFGLKSGCFIKTDFSISSVYVGPQIRVKL